MQSLIYPSVFIACAIAIVVRFKPASSRILGILGFGILALLYDLPFKPQIAFPARVIAFGCVCFSIVLASPKSSAAGGSASTSNSFKFAELFAFQGRIGRDTFWLTYSALIAISAVAGVVIVILEREGEAIAALFTSVVLSIVCIWPALAMQVKRWHDRDKSGLMVLINLIPIIGTIWALAELGFLRGTIGRNQYGDDPLQHSVESSRR